MDRQIYSRTIDWHQEACLVVPNSDARDKFVYSFLTLMIDFFLAYL